MTLNDTLMKLTKYLKKNKMKSTQERVKVLEVAFIIGTPVCDKKRCLRCGKCKNGGKHFSVDNIYTELKKQHFIVSHATVYRTVQMLNNAKIITFAFKRQGKIIYELFHEDPHDHLLCVKCGAITEFEQCEVDSLHKKLCKKYQFIEIDHIHAIRGLCIKCQ